MLNIMKVAVARSLANIIRSLDSAGASAGLRGTAYGEGMFVDTYGGRSHALADGGEYFVAQNPTDDLATTTAGHAAPVVADLYTKPFMHLINGATAAEATRCYLDFIEITVITAGATGSVNYWAAELDTGATRYSSGTVETMTRVNPNMQSTTTPKLVGKLGPFVASAASANQRKLGLTTNRMAIEFAGDKYLFVFGAPAGAIGAAVAGAQSRMVNLMPGVILGPTDQFLLHMFATSQNAAGVYKTRMGWWER